MPMPVTVHLYTVHIIRTVNDLRGNLKQLRHQVLQHYQVPDHKTARVH